MRTVALQLHAGYPNSFVQPINDTLLFRGFLDPASVFITANESPKIAGRGRISALLLSSLEFLKMLHFILSTLPDKCWNQ